jgi:hypothetical protein
MRLISCDNFYFISGFYSVAWVKFQLHLRSFLHLAAYYRRVSGSRNKTSQISANNEQAKSDSSCEGHAKCLR